VYRLLDLLAFLLHKCFDIGYYVSPGLVPYFCKYFFGVTCIQYRSCNESVKEREQANGLFGNTIPENKRTSH